MFTFTKRSITLFWLVALLGWLPFSRVHAAITTSTIAPFPFSDNFEATTLGPDWSTESTGVGRIELSTEDVYAGNQSIFVGQKTGGEAWAYLTLQIDLAEKQDVFLDFWWRTVDNGSHGGGVHISNNNGSTWKKVLDMGTNPKSYGRGVVNITDTAAANGLTLTDQFQIRFLFYGRSIGGYVIDNVRITTTANVAAGFPLQDSFETTTFRQGFYPRSTGIGVAEINEEEPFTGNASAFIGQKTAGEAWADLYLIVDLSGQEDVFLDFWWRAINNGSYDGGIYISDNDGATWKNVWNLTTDPPSYGHAVIDIASAAEAHGLSLNHHFRIRIFYYGRAIGGFFVDDLRLTTQAEVVAPIPLQANFESQTYPLGMYPVPAERGVVEITDQNPHSGSYSAFLGQKTNGESQARIWLLTDLANQQKIYLDFWWRAVDNGSYSSGVYISDNYGSTWTKIYNMGNDPTAYTHAILNIAETADAHGLTLNDHFLIYIYFYGRSIGGFLIDDLNIGSVDPRMRDAKFIYLPMIQR